MVLNRPGREARCACGLGRSQYVFVCQPSFSDNGPGLANPYLGVRAEEAQHPLAQLRSDAVLSDHHAREVSAPTARTRRNAQRRNLRSRFKISIRKRQRFRHHRWRPGLRVGKHHRGAKHAEHHAGCSRPARAESEASSRGKCNLHPSSDRLPAGDSAHPRSDERTRNNPTAFDFQRRHCG